jgi:hypothetical protein
MRFEVKIRGDWTPIAAEQFADVHARVGSDYILLSGDLDQPGLHGVLERVRRLGFELIDVRRHRSTGAHDHD